MRADWSQEAFSGAAILVKEWTRGIVENGVPLWLTNLSLNIPHFILATKLKGFSFVKKSAGGRYDSYHVAGCSSGVEAF